MSRARTQQSFQTVRSEGGLLPIDILQRIAAQDKELPGLTPDAYHLPPGGRFGEAISGAWSRVLASWRNFQDALARLPENDPATTLTREKFLLPLFEELKFGRLPKKTSSFEVDGRSYAISHEYHRSPIHMLGCRVSLEDRVAGLAGAAKSSPHGLVQDLLNRSEQHLWGFVTNGLLLRILRDHHSLTQQAYVEFDLQAMLDGEHYSDFVLLWLLCHQSRIEAERPEECWLERWMQAARNEGISALDKLRGGVEQAIAALGTGFLKHPRNAALKADLHSGDLDKQEYFRELRSLVYRCIFLFVAEDRGVLLDPNASAEARARYERFYSTRQLRTLSDRRRGGPHSDLWQGLRLVMDKLYEGCPELGLPALGSFLWSTGAVPNLRRAECANEYLLAATRALCFFTRGNLRFLVNWRQVGADELGSIFESLLELHPRLNQEAGTFELDTAAGHERKTTGSYYTPSSLVDCLLDSALDPVVDAAVAKKSREEAERALLNLKVCDPACGSGHFLVAAARRIAKRLAAVRTGDDEPSPTALQHALRDVVGHCIYGVDVNKMAVELCRVALWMEAIEPGRPLSFLDNHIQHGNSLMGATPALLKKGIPDEAFNAIEGDDKEVAKRLKKRNRDFRKKGQTSLEALLTPAAIPHTKLTAEAMVVEEDPDDVLPAVRKKESDWQRFTASQAYQDAQLLCDLWCAAFLWPKQAGELEANAPTAELWLRATQNPQTIPTVTKREVRKIAQLYSFFHWHLAFPHIFRQMEGSRNEETMGCSGGFDVVLGNPPWEKIQAEEQQFFSEKLPNLATAVGAARKNRIAFLKTSSPDVYLEWVNHKRAIAGHDQFSKETCRYPLTGLGKLNTYSLFFETSTMIVSKHGRVGEIVPQGIFSDKVSGPLFWKCISDQRIFAVKGFENEEFIFPGIHHSFKFVLVTVCGQESKFHGPDFVFLCRKISDLGEDARHFTLEPKDVAALNPTSLTCPIFRNKFDFHIAKSVYLKFPVIGNPDARSSWPIEIHRLLNASDDSEHFIKIPPQPHRQRELQHGSETLVPILEAKMLHQFDHRFGSYYGQTDAQANQGKLPELSEAEHQDAFLLSQPQDWISRDFAERKLALYTNRKWLVSVRDVTSSIVYRTAILSITPRLPSINSCWNLYFSDEFNVTHIVEFCIVFNSFAFDFIARQKISGNHMPPYVIEQLPMPNPGVFLDSISRFGQSRGWLHDRLLELVYTAWDLQDFARSLEYDGSPFIWHDVRRAVIRCELDAACFHLFGINREHISYIMDSFFVFRDGEESTLGSYRTKEQILDIYDRMQRAIDSGEPYQTLLDPPPADPRVAHPPREPKN